jgi:restriction system protein
VAQSPVIEGAQPATWEELELNVARILGECGYEVEVGKNIELARGDVNVDVWANEHTSPPNVLIVECKHWSRPVTKSVVHAFRAVTGDSGANTGLLVSSAGFQDGAREAATYSNVRLLTWDDFQGMFVKRWFLRYMSPFLGESTDALHEYTEPMNTRVFRKADALSETRRAEFIALRTRHAPLMILNFSFHPTLIENELTPLAGGPPALPLRAREGGFLTEAALAALPSQVLDATALRPLLDAMIRVTEEAVAEFDAVFGERA